MSGNVPKSDLAKVADVGRRFSGRDPQIVGEIKKPIAPAAVYVIGSLDAIEYTTEREGKIERYRHRFKKKDRPFLCVSPGKKVLVLGGNYRFTELGIVDDSDRKHRNAR